MEHLISTIGLFCLMAASLIYTFFGYRFFKGLLTCAGALIFGTFAWGIATRYFPEQPYIPLAIAIGSAILGGFVFWKLFKVAAFLYGSAAGVALSPIILTYIENPPNWLNWLVPSVCGFLGGIILLMSHRIIIITMTSASGSLYFCLSLLFLGIQYKFLNPEISKSPDNKTSIIALLIFSTIFITGWIYQYKDKKSEKVTN